MALKGRGEKKDLDADHNLQLGLEAEVIDVSPRAKRQAKQPEARQPQENVKAKDSYLDSLKELDDILLQFKKYSKSVSAIDNKVFGSLDGCFMSKNERVDAYAFACSSFTDKIEEYFYDPENSFPYKRGVKLVLKEGSIYVEPGADIDIYGICVDVCEFNSVAYVLPITNNFEGYLVTRNQHIKSGEILDINNKGVIIKAGGGPPTVINAYALSDAFRINFMPKDKNLNQDQPKENYSINLIKVAIFGNRGLEKKVASNAASALEA
ncbi:DUF228 domain-containing protein [Borreliella lusitaniae]|uniref:DUF228 domain-containing protein n=1 Tax=Borreliella lusitaniae TaxID=100177 RepID=UPI003C73261B